MLDRNVRENAHNSHDPPAKRCFRARFEIRGVCGLSISSPEDSRAVFVIDELVVVGLYLFVVTLIFSRTSRMNDLPNLNCLGGCACGNKVSHCRLPTSRIVSSPTSDASTARTVAASNFARISSHVILHSGFFVRLARGLSASAFGANSRLTTSPSPSPRRSDVVSSSCLLYTSPSPRD